MPDDEVVRVVDQRRLPTELVMRDLRTADEVRDAIATLTVRGAPAIGVAAAFGLAAAMAPFRDGSRTDFDTLLVRHAGTIANARPTAVNLGWAVDRVVARARGAAGDAATAWRALHAEAAAIAAEDAAMCDAIARHGLVFVPDGARVLTHCNAGALATAGAGTALAPVYAAHAAGRRVHVTAGETRPLLQGSRLTAWELSRAGIPVRVIADSMAPALMRRGEVDVVIVGADRIVANGDVANKVGTYALAVAARHHGIPFVVCAPASTIDAATPDGEAIVVEERDPAELRALAGAPIAPAGVSAWNPAFDVTPAALVSAIVTDAGVRRAPYNFSA